MTTEVWYGIRLKFQSPRHEKVVPNQNMTKTTTHDCSVTRDRYRRGVCPMTPHTHRFHTNVRHGHVQRGNIVRVTLQTFNTPCTRPVRRISVWVVQSVVSDHPCSGVEGLPMKPVRFESVSGVYVSNRREVEGSRRWMT